MRILMGTTVAVALLASTVAGVRGQSGTPTDSLVGVWEGTSVVRTGTNPYTIEKRLPAVTIFTRGGYYSSLGQDNQGPRPPRKPLPPLKTPGKPTDAEKIALADLVSGGVLAHSGRYEIKGNTVAQIRMVDMTAATGTTTFEYRVEDGGKTLKLITKNADSEVVRSYRRLE